MASSTIVSSCGPAGQNYESINDAGKQTLLQYFDTFPNTSHSFIVPPVFRTSYPESLDTPSKTIERPPRPLTKEEENKYLGIVLNSQGEQAECRGFQVFEKLVKQSNHQPKIIFQGFKPDTTRFAKRTALENELGMSLNHLKMQAEYDFLVLVKDLGVVLVEVKLKLSEQVLRKAQQQLHDGAQIFNTLMPSSNRLPVVKMIFAPVESTPSSHTNVEPEIYLLHCEDMPNFNTIWTDVLKDLENLKLKNPFNESQFQRFSNLITGLWCMQPLKQKYFFSNKDASLDYGIRSTDDMINYAMLSSDNPTDKSKTESRKSKSKKTTAPVTNVCYNDPDSVARTTSLNVFYFTPRQKELYDT